jgi:hypothetical protein
MDGAEQGDAAAAGLAHVPDWRVRQGRAREGQAAYDGGKDARDEGVGAGPGDSGHGRIML